MGRSSLLGIDRVQPTAPGRDTDALGPSDSSDSGSDVLGIDVPDDGGPDAAVDKALADDVARPETSAEAVAPGADSDSHGTGERRSAAGDRGARDAADILPDRIIGTDADSEEAIEALAAEAAADEDDEEEDEAIGEDEDEDPVGRPPR
jgi:hypothetical protein